MNYDTWINLHLLHAHVEKWFWLMYSILLHTLLRQIFKENNSFISKQRNIKKQRIGFWNKNKKKKVNDITTIVLANAKSKLKKKKYNPLSIQNSKLWSYLIREVLHLLLHQLAFIFAERRLCWECLDTELTNDIAPL